MKEDSKTASAIRALAERRRLPEAHLGRWLRMAESDGAALLDLATRLNLRTGQLVEALLMLEEVAVRGRITIASVLVRGEVRAALGASGSGPGRATNFIHALRALRFPRLLDLRRRLGEQIRALCLPRGVSVILPRDLNSDELKSSFGCEAAGSCASI